MNSSLLVSLFLEGGERAMSALDQNVSPELLAEVWQSLPLPGSFLHHLSLKLCCLF